MQILRPHGFRQDEQFTLSDPALLPNGHRHTPERTQAMLQKPVSSRGRNVHSKSANAAGFRAPK